MHAARDRALAILLIVCGLSALWPIQTAIDRRRNTFRVWLYPEATQAEIDKVVEGLNFFPELADRIETGRGLRVDNSVGSHADDEDAPKKLQYSECPYVQVLVPRSEWGRDLSKYSVRVQRLPMVAGVVPGLNEQGLPLDRIQELNVQDVGIVVIAALIGGFRKSAANVLWLQSDANWYEGRHYRTVPLARAVVTLDPHFVDAWTVTCWHLAYNMSVEAKNPSEAASFIKQGIDFAEQGLSWNSTRYEVYLELGWTYYDKLQNYARAAEYFKLALNHPHPTFVERHIAHAYERIPDIERALFWYDVSLKKYGNDPIATGAIVTINERYVRAWQKYKDGDLDTALRYLYEDWQPDDPYDTIGMHFKARIFETKGEKARKQGDLDEAGRQYRVAFETWMAAGRYNATDRLARRRTLTLAQNWGWNADIPAGWNDVGLPDSWVDKSESSEMFSAPRQGPQTRSEAGKADEASEAPAGQ